MVLSLWLFKMLLLLSRNPQHAWCLWPFRKFSKKKGKYAETEGQGKKVWISTFKFTVTPSVRCNKGAPQNFNSGWLHFQKVTLTFTAKYVAVEALQELWVNGRNPFWGNSKVPTSLANCWGYVCHCRYTVEGNWQWRLWWQQCNGGDDDQSIMRLNNFS